MNRRSVTPPPEFAEIIGWILATFCYDKAYKDTKDINDMKDKRR